MSRVLVLDVIGGTGFHEAECDALKDFYRELKCDCFDITTRALKGKTYDIFCDDIGLFNESPIPSAVCLDDNGDVSVALVGNLVFANHDREGNTTSLSDSDISHIKDNSVVLCDVTEGLKHWLAIVLDY